MILSNGKESVSLLAFGLTKRGMGVFVLTSYSLYNDSVWTYINNINKYSAVTKSDFKFLDL